jgi:hypothetical protein
MQSITEVKMLLMDVLESAFQSGDVTATQQLGVNMSNAVKRDGVVIIQNQNVEVYARIMPTMVKALRMCDALETKAHRAPVIQYEPAPAQLPAPAAAPGSDPVDACCSWLYENRIRWQEMQDLMRARYLSHVLGRFKTKNEAARYLGVGNTYLCKLSRTATS